MVQYLSLHHRAVLYVFFISSSADNTADSVSTAAEPRNIEVVHRNKNFSFCRLLVTLSLNRALASLLPLSLSLLRQPALNRIFFVSVCAGWKSLFPFQVLLNVQCCVTRKPTTELHCKNEISKAGGSSEQDATETLAWRASRLMMTAGRRRCLHEDWSVFGSTDWRRKEAKYLKNGCLDFIHVLICFVILGVGSKSNRIFYPAWKVGPKLLTPPHDLPLIDFTLTSKHVFAYLTLTTDWLFLNGLIFL